MSLAETFPDIEKALILGLPAALEDIYVRAGVTTADHVPPEEDLSPALANGFIRVQLLDDPDDTITRYATVDIDCFAGTRSLAYDVAQEVRGVLMVSRKVGGITLDRVSTESGPKRVPWDSSNTTRRFLATYRISTRR